ncbi:hypothetical protein DL96DRAFT_1676385 [Flagelloscypha sp. PMI_526]|nr:hypothetical protein DL96DRAFT_1676385 [Flagelloscypha sp. PMI_526]
MSVQHPHAQFNAPDADVAIVSSDNALFKIHSRNLKFNGSLLLNYITKPLDSKDNAFHSEYSNPVLTVLCAFLYPNIDHPTLHDCSIPFVLEVGAAANKCSIPAAIAVCFLRAMTVVQNPQADLTTTLLVFQYLNEFHLEDPNWSMDDMAQRTLGAQTKEAARYLRGVTFFAWSLYKLRWEEITGQQSGYNSGFYPANLVPSFRQQLIVARTHGGLSSSTPMPPSAFWKSLVSWVPSVFLTKHDRFNDATADTCIVSSDGVLFKIHSNNLSFSSDAFALNFDSTSKDDLAFFDEPADVLGILFAFIYPDTVYPTLLDQTIVFVRQLCTAAQKYMIPSAMAVCHARVLCVLWHFCFFCFSSIFFRMSSQDPEASLETCLDALDYLLNFHRDFPSWKPDTLAHRTLGADMALASKHLNALGLFAWTIYKLQWSEKTGSLRQSSSRLHRTQQPQTASVPFPLQLAISNS